MIEGCKDVRYLRSACHSSVTSGTPSKPANYQQWTTSSIFCRLPHHTHFLFTETRFGPMFVALDAVYLICITKSLHVRSRTRIRRFLLTSTQCENRIRVKHEIDRSELIKRYMMFDERKTATHFAMIFFARFLSSMREYILVFRCYGSLTSQSNSQVVEN